MMALDSDAACVADGDCPVPWAAGPGADPGLRGVAVAGVTNPGQCNLATGRWEREGGREGGREGEGGRDGREGERESAMRERGGGRERQENERR